MSDTPRVDKPAPEQAKVGKHFPPWLRKRLPAAAGEAERVRDVLADLGLASVCQSARCPNLHECYHAGTATFMILGDCCTRRCRFCAVRQERPQAPDPDEPRRVAEAAARLHLRYVVVTSVTRDDLPDGGAAHFRATILAIRQQTGAAVEVLTPDFGGNLEAVDSVAAAGPVVYNHNMETVPRLYQLVRPQADYERSLRVLERVRRTCADIPTKSGLMLGLGETGDEVRQVLRDLRCVGCTMLTLGQYLQPSPRQLAVQRFVPPEEFNSWREEALAMGFSAVAAGSFVRSSYGAGKMLASCGTGIGVENEH